ncbi:MAG: carbohydrate ABC transporter permease, partial [Halobacteriaceae archaeon]
MSFRAFTLSPNVADPWVGLENYQYWLIGNGASFLAHSTRITLLLVMVILPLDIIFGLGTAMVVSEKLPVRSFWRGVMLAGYASPSIAAGLVFDLMQKNAPYGIIYNALNTVFAMPEVGGMASSIPWAFWGLVMATVWRDFGLVYIILLAGLQSVPDELYEISRVDGAGPIQRF